MNYNQWFHDQLQASAAGFTWGVEQIPEPRRYIQPPAGLGEWSVARHVFHLFFYERQIALPSMRQWALGAPVITDEPDEEAAWSAAKLEKIENLLAEFETVRLEQIDLLDRIDEGMWTASRQAVWGPVTLLWVVSKTYQHTAEHTSDVMRIGLFWDAFAVRQNEA